MQVIMSRTFVKADVDSILLLTDGLANVGISNTEGIIATMKDPFAHQALANPNSSQNLIQEIIA